MMIRLLISAWPSPPRRVLVRPDGEIRDIFSPPKVGAFTTGLKQYENGDYAESAKNLQSALDRGLGDRDRVVAHKHSRSSTAFPAANANAATSSAKLSPWTRPWTSPPRKRPPIWGPIFRTVKAGR